MGANDVIRSLNNTIMETERPVIQSQTVVVDSTNKMLITTKTIYDEILNFKNNMMKGEEKQIAHERLLQIDQVLKENFSHHEEIRRVVMGVVRDCDINLVRNSTIRELSDELWITSSRYWLSYALIAITAWINDYPDVARNALSETVRKDQVKATLFFCLMNLRFGRLSVAKAWFREYIKTLNPEMLEKETSVMLQAFFNGIFGIDQELRNDVETIIDNWVGIIESMDDVCQELVNAYSDYIKTLPADTEFNYPALKEFCTNVDPMKETLNALSRYNNIMKLLESINGGEVEQNPANYKNRVDALLIQLITNYDDEEEEVRKEKDLYELIVEHNGDVKKAKEALEVKQKQEVQSNIGNQFINWAIYSEEDNQIRRFGFTHTRKWFSKALDHYEMDIIDNYVAEYNISIDGWTSTSNGSDEEEQNESMQNYYDNNKFQHMYVNTLNITAVVAFILSLGCAFITPYALVISAVSLGFIAFRVLSAMKKYPERVQTGLANLSATMAELAEYQSRYRTMRELKDKISEYIEYNF